MQKINILNKTYVILHAINKKLSFTIIVASQLLGLGKKEVNHKPYSPFTRQGTKIKN